MDLLNNIDGKATEAALEKAFLQYRTYQLTTPEDYLPTITQNFTLELQSFGGLPHSKTESAAIKSVDHFRKASQFFEKFNRSMSKLTKVERQIIYKACLAETLTPNYVIANELNMSERTFYRRKQPALYKLALALGVEVYETDECEVNAE